MPNGRAERVALTEAAFRIANERMAAWEERHRDGLRELYLCECGSQPCRQRIALSREEYEAVRADVTHFLVVPGHVIPDLETVVASLPSHEIIEKPDALMDLLVDTDPRHARTGEATGAAAALADELGPNAGPADA